MDIYENNGYIIDGRFPDNHIHETAIIGTNVRIGVGNIIMPYSVIGQMGFIREGEKPNGVIQIGDNNTIGLYVNIMAGRTGKTFIGNGNLIMNHSNVGHNVIIENSTEIGAGCILNGYSIIKSDVKIKSGCVIRNRKTIGRGATIGQGANVIKNVKSNAVVYGNPATNKATK